MNSPINGLSSQVIRAGLRSAAGIVNEVNVSRRSIPPHRYTWLVQLLSVAALGAVHTALPYGVITAVIFVGTSMLITGSMGLALWRRKELQPYPSWVFAFIAILLSVPGSIIWYTMDLWADGARSVFSTLFYFGTYACLFISLWLYGRKVESASGALVDALMVVTAAAGLFWVLLVVPYVGDSNQGLINYLVAVAYPLVDLLMLTFVLKLVFISGERPPAQSLMLLALTLVLTADLLHAYQQANGTYLPGGAMDLLWFATYGFLAAAIWHPSATQALNVRLDKQPRPYRRLWVIGLLVLAVPVFLLLTAGSDPVTLRVAAMTSIVLFLLMMNRLGLLLLENRRQADTLTQLVRTDPLTGAANRRWLEERLTLEIARSDRTGEYLWVAFLDLDYFKRFNGTRGHAAGDTLLIQLVKNWQQAIRDTDLLARIGGEEFVLVLTGLEQTDCQAMLERLRDRVPSDQTCSAGLAAYRRDDDLHSLIDRADQALYQAKRAGRDVVVTVSDNFEPVAAGT